MNLGFLDQNLFRTIKKLVPARSRAKLREIKNKVTVPGYSSAPVRRPLTKYVVHDAQLAEWSPDHNQPYGVVENAFEVPHLLLARAVLHLCKVQSWCDLGSGVASLPLAAAKFGLNDVLAIDGTDAALRAGLVRFPLTNYFVADATRPIIINYVNSTSAEFDLVSALEVLEHIPEYRLREFFANILRMNPKFVLLSVGLQPDPPYHVNLKSMPEWIQSISAALQEWEYDDDLSQEIFLMAKKHPRFKNDYHTNCFPDDRNILIFVRQK